MPEIDLNNMNCPGCKKRFEFVMIVYGPWGEKTDRQMAEASVDWVECSCGATYTRKRGWKRAKKKKVKKEKYDKDMTYVSGV
jgi:hypothetical protein